MKFYIYILISLFDNSFYIGYTTNIEERLWKHNYGRTRYTKLKRPWKLVYVEKFSTKSEAISREKYLKSLKSRKYIINLIKSHSLTGP